MKFYLKILVYLFVNSVNESEPSGEVSKKGSVQLMAEDIPCTFCTVRGGRKGRLHKGSAKLSGFPP